MQTTNTSAIVNRRKFMGIDIPTMRMVVFALPRFLCCQPVARERLIHTPMPDDPGSACGFSLCRAARHRRRRSHGPQLVQLTQYGFPIVLVLLRRNQDREIRIIVENVSAQVRRGTVELPL